jgi:MscS family membrane protein
MAHWTARPARAAESAVPDPLAGLLPTPLVEIRWLDVQLWQWLGVLALGFVAAMLSWAAAALLVRGASVLARRAGRDGGFPARVAGPLRLLLTVILFSAGSVLLALPPAGGDAIAQGARIAVIAAITWLLLRTVDILARAIEQRFVVRGQMAAISVVPLGRRTVKVFLFALAMLAVLQHLGFNVTSLLAGLGIGGLAVALAAQKSVENLFGGVTLIADQPVRVGDFCRFGDRVGTVEDVGLRSTRVRTLDRTVVTIPNSQFATMALENFAQRDRIWLNATIGLRYETTPDQLRHVLIELKRLLLGHPKIDPDPARVRFVGFGAYSLDLEIFAYVRTADINEFLAIREDVLLRIMDVVAGSGTSFAFPSRTLYLAFDPGLDGRRTKTVEEEVRGWRESRELLLPNVPPAVAARIAGTLDYPPLGSAAG